MEQYLRPYRLRLPVAAAILVSVLMAFPVLPSAAARGHGTAAFPGLSEDPSAGGRNATVPSTGSAPVSPSLPAVCSTISPAELIPWRPGERGLDLLCSAAAVRQEQSLHPAGPVPASTGTTNPPGFILYEMAMAYDSSDGYVLLIGATGTGTLGGTETWTFTQGTWSELFPTASPQSCAGSVMAYDEVDGYVVYLAGGAANCTSAGETWTFHAGQWTKLAPTLFPPGRQGAAFTNDSADGYMLLFGGYNASTSKYIGDTWKFVAGSWTKVSPSASPSTRSGAGLAYDAADGYVVLFGGSNVTGCVGGLGCMDQDTWKYSAGVWTQLNPVGRVPPEPNDDGLVYDASDHSVLYTVTDDNNTYRDPEIYWSFHAGNWTDLNNWSLYNTATVPRNRMGEGLVYDWKDGYAVLFGGSNIRWASLSDTWSYHARVWDNLTAPFTVALTSSPDATDVGGVVEFSTTILTGGAGPYTYSYSGLPAGCRTQNAPSMQCTPASAGSFTVSVNVTNASHVSRFAPASLTVNPDPTIASFIPAPASIPLGASTTFQVSATLGTGTLSYSYSQLPPGCGNTDTANLVCTPSATGGYRVRVEVSDSVGMSASANATLLVTLSGNGSTPPPTILYFRAIPATIGLGDTTTFVLSTSGGYPPLDYHYTNVPAGCTALNRSFWDCTPSSTGTFGVTAWVFDSQGRFAQQSTQLTVNTSGAPPPPEHAALTILAFFASPAVIALGASTVLEAFAQGGSLPLSFTYVGLPPGCQSASTPSLACSPASPGNFSVFVSVRDSRGNSTFASTILQVGSAPVASATAGGSSGVPVEWVEASLGVAGLALGLAAGALFLRSRARPPTGPG